MGVLNFTRYGGLSWVSVWRINNLILLKFSFLPLRTIEQEHGEKGKKSKLSH